MSKATTIKEALGKWERQNGQKLSQVKEVKLIGLIPPIEKMESFTTIAHIEKLSISTSCIEKINNLHVFKNLKVLSLGRNYIKNLTGLEAIAETLEELWISYNLIERLTGMTTLKKLKVLYMSNNSVKDWMEFQKLVDLTCLEDLLFVGNPIEEKHSVDGTWRTEVGKRLPNLKKLDGVPVIRDNEEEMLKLAMVQNKDADTKSAEQAAMAPEQNE